VLPTTIDGVIDNLQAIVDDTIRTGSRLGYFAALYKRMTMAIRGGMLAGKFQDNARIERLDVAFAGRYIVTREQYFAGELHGQSWLQAYDATNSGKYTVLQQLLIGINPHIMIDLGVAAARTCPGDQLAGLQQDFNMVNAIILSLFPVIDAELDDLSPFDNFIDHHGFLKFMKDKSIDIGIDIGRKSSWDFATSLAYLDLPAQAIAIGRRDLEALELGKAILAWPAIGSKRESADIRHNIQVLNAAATAAAKTPQTSSRQP